MAGQASRLAFTLAEVLITLGIIGVVAAMTIPVLVNKIDDKANIARWKKTYSVLNNAFNAVRADGVELCAAHNHPSGAHLCTNQNPDPKLQSGIWNPEFIEVFLSKLNVVKTCGSDPYLFAEPCKAYKDSYVWYCTWNICYAPLGVKREMHSELRNYGIKDFKGPNVSDGIFWQYFGTQIILLQDGTVLYLGVSNMGGPHIMADVNGWRQGPNTLGRDLFAVVLNEKQILPIGADGVYGSNDESFGASACSKAVGTYGGGVTNLFEAPGAGCSYKYLLN